MLPNLGVERTGSVGTLLGDVVHGKRDCDFWLYTPTVWLIVSGTIGMGTSGAAESVGQRFPTFFQRA